MLVLHRPKLSSRCFSAALLLLFLSAFALRVVFALPALRSPERLLRPDSSSYLFPALTAAGRPPDFPYRLLEGSDPEDQALRPPGYPWFLAAVLALFRGRLLPLFLAGCLVGAATVFPVAACGRILAGRAAGLAAAGFYALNLTALSSSPLILSDTLFGFFCAVMAWGLLLALRTRSACAFACASAAAAAGLLVKPIDFPVLAGLLPFLLSWILLRSFRKAAVAAGLCLALLFLCMTCSYLFRDGRGGFWIADPNSGMTATHNAAAVLAASSGENGDLVRFRLNEEAEREFAAQPERFASLKSRNEWLERRFLRIAIARPWDFVRTHFFQFGILLPDLPTFSENLGLSVGGSGALAVLRQKGIFAAFRHYAGADGARLLCCAAPFLAIAFFLYFACACFLAASFLWRRTRFLVLFFLVVGYFFTAPGPVLMPRYQLAFLPFLCAAGGAALFLRFARRKQPSG